MIEGVIAGALRVKQWHSRLLEQPGEATWWIAAVAVVALAVFTYFARRYFSVPR